MINNNYTIHQPGECEISRFVDLTERSDDSQIWEFWVKVWIDNKNYCTIHGYLETGYSMWGTSDYIQEYDFYRKKIEKKLAEDPDWNGRDQLVSIDRIFREMRALAKSYLFWYLKELGFNSYKFATNMVSHDWFMNKFNKAQHEIYERDKGFFDYVEKKRKAARERKPAQSQTSEN